MTLPVFLLPKVFFKGKIIRREGLVLWLKPKSGAVGLASVYASVVYLCYAISKLSTPPEIHTLGRILLLFFFLLFYLSSIYSELGFVSFKWLHNA